MDRLLAPRVGALCALNYFLEASLGFQPAPTLSERLLSHKAVDKTNYREAKVILCEVESLG